MTTYTREELKQMSDNDLEMVYREVTTKPFDPTKKTNDVIEEIVKQSQSIGIPEKEKKTRKKPVSKVRSTMLQTEDTQKGIPKAITNLLMTTDAELDTPVYDEKKLKENRPMLKIKNITSPEREIKSPTKTTTRSSPKRGRPRTSMETVTGKSTGEVTGEATGKATGKEDVPQEPIVVEPMVAEPMVAEPIVAEPMVAEESFVSEGKMEIPDEMTIPPPPPLRKGRPKKEDSLKKSTSVSSRRGRPPSDRTIKKSVNKSEILQDNLMNIVRMSSQMSQNEDQVTERLVEPIGGSVVNLSRSFDERMVLNPNASFQKMDDVKDSKNILPMTESRKQKITDFLHSIPFAKSSDDTIGQKKESEKIMDRSIEEQIENITNGISQMTTMERPKRTRASPKIRMIDDEIEQLTKRIQLLKSSKKDIGSKKSIQDLISEKIDIQTPKRAPRKTSQQSKDLMSRIEEIESVSSSRSRSSKKSVMSEDIVNVLKEVDKNRVSGKRGKNYYSAEELMKFLSQIQMTISGSKEILAQRLLDVIEKYGL